MDNSGGETSAINVATLIARNPAAIGASRNISRFRDGRMVEHWALLDEASIIRQLK
jgi:hypothetical protein